MPPVIALQRSDFSRRKVSNDGEWSISGECVRRLENLSQKRRKERISYIFSFAGFQNGFRSSRNKVRGDWALVYVSLFSKVCLVILPLSREVRKRYKIVKLTNFKLISTQYCSNFYQIASQGRHLKDNVLPKSDSACRRTKRPSLWEWRCHRRLNIMLL